MMSRPSLFIQNLLSPSIRGLALSVAGGFFCSWLQTPLPWMIGPLLATASMRLLGTDVSGPKNARSVGQTLIGCSLGLYFTPVVVGALSEHMSLMVFAAFLSILVGYLCAFFLAGVSGADKTTAVLACMPGSAAEMTTLAERHGASVDRVVFAQSLRMLLVVILVPTALTLVGAHGTDPYIPSPPHISYPGLALLFTFCVTGGAILAALNVPNAWMLGPLAVSIAVTIGELGLSGVPQVLSNLGQLLLGCILGARFDRKFLKGGRRFILSVIGSIFLALILSAFVGAALGFLSGIPVATMVLAAAPGGIGEMGITAKVLQLGVPLVTAFHVTRIVILVTLASPMFKLARRVHARIRHRPRD